MLTVEIGDNNQLLASTINISESNSGEANCYTEN